MTASPDTRTTARSPDAPPRGRRRALLLGGAALVVAGVLALWSTGPEPTTATADAAAAAAPTAAEAPDPEVEIAGIADGAVLSAADVAEVTLRISRVSPGPGRCA
jgi:hypothetical protein